MSAWAIARNTFREATRDRVLAGVGGAGVALLATTQVIGGLSLGEERRLTVDLGLSGITVLGVLVVILVGTSLVAKEIERRTIYNLLSRPISRHTYLIGKWGGLSAALWLLCAGLGTALWVTLTVRGFHGHGPGVLQATYMAGLELTVVTSLAVLFSALSTPVLSALYTLAFYVVGQWSYDLRELASKFPGGAAGALQTVANVFPNLPLFNMRSLAAAADTTSVAHLVMATCYAALYCGCTLALATAAFETRDFK